MRQITDSDIEYLRQNASLTPLNCIEWSSHGLRLMFGWMNITIASKFEFRTATETQTIEPPIRDPLPLGCLLDQPISSFEIASDHCLVVWFGEGNSLKILPDPDIEWEQCTISVHHRDGTNGVGYVII